VDTKLDRNLEKIDKTGKFDYLSLLGSFIQKLKILENSEEQ
jgi:hypothetical protein